MKTKEILPLDILKGLKIKEFKLNLLNKNFLSIDKDKVLISNILIDSEIKKFVYEKDFEEAKAFIAKLFKCINEASIELRISTSNLQLLDFRFLAILNPDKVNYNIYAIDLGKSETYSEANALKNAMNKIGDTYFEVDLSTRIVKISPNAQKKFNLTAIEKDFPNNILDNETVFEDDKIIYLSEINKLISGKKDNVKFDIRMCYFDKYTWQRRSISSVRDKDGKPFKLIGIMLTIEEEIAEKFNYNANMSNLNNFSQNYISYLLINLTNTSVMATNSETFDLERNFVSTNVDTFKKEILKTILDNNEKALFSEFISIENLNKVEQSLKKIKYHRLNNNGYYIWVESELRHLKDPYNDNNLVIIESYDINQVSEESEMLNELINIENEIVIRACNKTSQVITYAKENNFLEFKPGISFNKFEDSDKEMKTINNLLTQINNDSPFYTLDKAFSLLKPYTTYNYLFESKINPKRYFRIIRYYDKEKESLISYMNDVTKVIENDIRIKDNLEKAIQDAQFANYKKDNFFARMSHDMRTPMTAILGMIDFAKEDNKQQEISTYLNQIEESSKHLLSLLNDVLDLQSIENKKSKYKVYDTFELFKTIYSIILIEAKQKEIIFNFNNSLANNFRYQYIDKVAARQLFLNILTNAIKYTNNDGTISWNIISYKKENKYIIKHIISDNGIGMSQEFQEIMYNKYTREDSKLGENIKGTGLGLNIVKSIIENWKGTIKCQSEYGKGTCFTIEYPAIMASKKDCEDLYEEKKLLDYSCLKNKKILLAEDVEINAKIITRILEDKEMKVFWVKNGLQAIFEVENNYYDLIIMDIRMPILNGIYASKKIRTFNPDIPIIALSANAYEEDINRSIEVGMNDHLSKPIDKEQLFSTLTKYLSTN